MSEKAVQSAQFVDQLAKTAHSLVDDMQGRMLAMEDEFQSRSKEGGEQLVAGVERRVKTLENYIEANPAMAAAVAFGIGVFATRIFKGSGAGPAKLTATEEAPKPKPKPKVSKAA